MGGLRTRHGVFGEMREPGCPGTLRFYDPGRAFGFVALDCGEDAYLSGAAVAASRVDVAALVPGARLRGTVDWSGTASFERLDPTDGTVGPVPPRRGAESGAGEGTITRWVAERGFGFARVDGAPMEVFLHVTVVARSGFAPFAGARCSVTWERQRDRVCALSVESLPDRVPAPPPAARGCRNRERDDGDWSEDPLSPLGPARDPGRLPLGLGVGPQARGTMAR